MGFTTYTITIPCCNYLISKRWIRTSEDKCG